MNRRWKLFTFALAGSALIASGCGSGSSNSGIADEGAAVLAGDCSERADFPYAPNPEARSRIEDRLALIAPRAQLAYSASRGTLSGLTELELEVGSCEDGDNAAKVLAGLLERESSIFQMDPAEWSFSVVPCETVGKNTLIVGYRQRMAGVAVAKDTMSFRVYREGKGLVLASVSGFYLPQEIPGLKEFTTTCPSVAEAQAFEASAKAGLDYATFVNCIPTGFGSYKPVAPDAFTFAGHEIRWGDLTGVVEMRIEAPSTLVVDPAHHTDELLQSTAHCPWGRVGFELSFDPAGGGLLRQSPGIGCVVCATGGTGAG